jgi:acetylglutamate kinase
MDTAIRKADTLIEALGYIRTFRNHLTVIKLGGSAMEDPDVLRATLQDVVFMETVGLRPVLVHGGGKPIDRAMEASGIRPRKILGRRYTDEATLALVVQVLLHEVNAGIVRQIRNLGGRAVGLHTEALQALFGEKLMLMSERRVLHGDTADDSLAGQESPIDLGRVGRVTRVESAFIEDFCGAGVVPVIPCLAQDGDGGWLNVNADTAASAVATHLKAEKLVFLTDTPGILEDRNDPASLCSHLDAARCRDLVARGVIDGGMIPKIEACLDSLRTGVRKTHIIDGRLKHSLLLEIFTDRGVGTEIVLGQ